MKKVKPIDVKNLLGFIIVFLPMAGVSLFSAFVLALLDFLFSLAENAQIGYDGIKQNLMSVLGYEEEDPF